MSIEAMKQALDALEDIHPGNMTPMAEDAWNKAITALKQAIKQAEQVRPVAYTNRIQRSIGEERLLNLSENFDLNKCQEIIRFVRRIERYHGIAGEKPAKVCPKCGSDDVSIVSQEENGEIVCSADSCSECGHQWNVG